MESLLQDVRYGLRVLVKNPGFTAVAVLTLALGIGANTAIFSLINAVMLRMLPVTEPGRLVVVGDPEAVHSRSLGDPSVKLFSYPLYRELSANQVFSGMLASGEVHNLPVSIAGAADTRLTGVLVSGNYFSVLGVSTTMGRTIGPDDDTGANAHPVVVLSHTLWKEKFGQDPNVVGRTININKNPFSVIGVAPAGFFGDTVGDTQDLWIPVTMQTQVITGRAWLESFNASWLHCIGRLKPGTGIEQARANLNVLLQQLANGPMGAKLHKDDLENLKKGKIQVSAGGGGFSDLRGSFREPLLLLMFIVGLVLLIACVNVANLLLARASSRQKEMAVRLAIGASPGRVVRQLLTESLLLSFAGGALGLLVAQWGTGALLRLSGETGLQAPPDAGVFLFTATVCVFTGVLFGLIPALRSGRISVAPTLKSGSQHGGNGRSVWSWGKMLVASQVALSLLVLFAAGLLVRSLQNMRNLDLGYSREGLTLISTDPLGAGYSPAQIANFANEISARLASLPGVRAVCSSKNGLFSGSESGESIKVEGYVAAKEEDNTAASDDVGVNYFAAVGIPLLLGRDIGLQDTAASPRVAVINETMAKFYFGNTNPIGKKFTFGQEDDKLSKVPVEIIGVSRDARDHEIRGTVPRRYYVPIAQAANTLAVLNFEVRTAGNATSVVEAARQQIKAFDSKVPIYRVRSLNESVDRQISNEILIAKLSSFFAGLALLLACVGLYGVMSYSVTARTREIGVRMALGAQRPDVLWLVLREAMKLVVVGVIIGIPAAFLSSRLLSSMLFGLKATDMTSMLAVVLVLVTVALIAGFVPARRATKVDPMVALRYE
ncbi:MAG TPA: ABC transporter permease [Verrucomicrobiae bacterium]|jgi:predicted permease|nr:ABC transporter permease [Verrucomicrobiae bacterium]